MSRVTASTTPCPEVRSLEADTSTGLHTGLVGALLQAEIPASKARLGPCATCPWRGSPIRYDPAISCSLLCEYLLNIFFISQ